MAPLPTEHAQCHYCVINNNGWWKWHHQNSRETLFWEKVLLSGLTLRLCLSYSPNFSTVRNSTIWLYIFQSFFLNSQKCSFLSLNTCCTGKSIFFALVSHFFRIMVKLRFQTESSKNWLFLTKSNRPKHFCYWRHFTTCYKTINNSKVKLQIESKVNLCIAG